MRVDDAECNLTWLALHSHSAGSETGGSAALNESTFLDTCSVRSLGKENQQDMNRQAHVLAPHR